MHAFIAAVAFAATATAAVPRAQQAGAAVSPNVIARDAMATMTLAEAKGECGSFLDVICCSWNDDDCVSVGNKYSRSLPVGDLDDVRAGGIDFNTILAGISNDVDITGGDSGDNTDVVANNNDGNTLPILPRQAIVDDGTQLNDVCNAKVYCCDINTKNEKTKIFGDVYNVCVSFGSFN